MGRSGWIVLAFFAVAGCSSEEPLEVFVDLRTDLLPTQEFVQVDVSLDARDGSWSREDAFVVSTGDDFVGGLRVAEFGGVGRGAHRLLVRLRASSGLVVAERPAALELRDDRLVTIVITRDCRDVVCDDPAASACLQGVCVPEDCTPETPENCPTPSCQMDMDCTPPAGTCADAVCAEGACLARERAGNPCGEGAYCDPDVGCIGEEPGLILELTVEPVYSAHADWNDYIANRVPTDSAFDQDGTPCNPELDGQDASSCIHAADKMRVAIAELSNCAGLRLEDDLGVFRWMCRETVSGVEFVSSLAPTRGLRHLVTADAWLPNHVVLTSDGAESGQSAASTWWSNPVVPLPDSTTAPVLLEDSGTVYTLAADASTYGYNVNEDSVAVVILPGATLRAVDAIPFNTTWPSGELNTAGDASAVLAVGLQNYTWIEGDIDASRAQYGVFVRLGAMNRLRGVSVIGNRGAAFLLRTASLTGTELRSANGVRGAWIHSLNDSHLHDLAFTNHSNGGISGGFTNHNTISSLLSANNEIGMSAGTGSNTYFGAVLINNNNKCILSWAGTDNTFAQIISTNNSRGMSFEGGTLRNVFANIVAVQNVEGDITLNGSDLDRFSHLLFADSCWVPGSPTMPALEDGSCAMRGASDGTLVSGALLTFSFRGKVEEDDPTNASDINGSASGDSIVDWTHFESPLRAWGHENFGTGSSTRGRCSGAITCSIWDWRLSVTDTTLRDRSGVGTTANQPFEANAPCPSPVSETMFLDDTSGRRFLINAMEIVGDGFGNENGLCETDEACIYMPNIGPYQGGGDYTTQTCEMSGAFASVTMYAYPDP